MINVPSDLSRWEKSAQHEAAFLHTDIRYNSQRQGNAPAWIVERLVTKVTKYHAVVLPYGYCIHWCRQLLWVCFSIWLHYWTKDLCNMKPMLHLTGVQLTISKTHFRLKCQLLCHVCVIQPTCSILYNAYPVYLYLEEIFAICSKTILKVATFFFWP
jgi:hypothetical protein